LLPGLFVVVGAYVLISAVRFSIGDPHADGGFVAALASALAGLAYVSNIVIAWHGSLPHGIQHLWSLAAEEQFYLVWPVSLVLLARFGKSYGTLMGTACVGVVAVELHRLQLVLGGAAERRVWMGPDTTADALLLGCVVGVLYCSGTLERLVQRKSWRLVAEPLGFLTLAATALLVPNTARPLYALLVPVVAVGAAVLIAAAACDSTGVTGILSHQFVVNPGRISYGLYLWHPVFLYGLGVSAPLPAVLASFAAAYLSFAYIERPFLRRRRRPEAPSDPHPRVQSPALATP
jgi:peptidoglycan/LPS O-acetylase OafA/YrhL